MEEHMGEMHAPVRKGGREVFFGLSDSEVADRIAHGQVNVTEDSHGKSVKEIILTNTLTFFNLINVVLLVMVLLTFSFKNMLFILIVAINTVIGIVQELRAKKTLDELTILTASKAHAIREGREVEIGVEEIVLDDLLHLRAGDQIPADAVIVKGKMEVNESLLTGESDAVVKGPEDEIFSGSFVTSGRALCRVCHVGKDNYMEKITAEAKTFKKHDSQLRNSINKILKVISIIIVPVGGLLFAKQYFLTDVGFDSAILSTVAAVLGMIPEGLVLLTSVALALGVIRLASRKTLVQELYCIETLARVDMLCLDKTGTLTEGRIRVEDVEVLDDTIPLASVMGNMVRAIGEGNATFDALEEYYERADGYEVDHVIPFSSDRKYSGVVFGNEGTYLMGAAQFLFPQGEEELKAKCRAYAEDGSRVLVVAYSREKSVADEIPDGLRPCGLIRMSDVIREEAPHTLAYFGEQGVSLKVISGDDPVTVSFIAKRCGLPDAEKYVDATTLETDEDLKKALRECSVFGRVTPKQKKAMVTLLKEDGQTVAMTGDGVNDVLALKEADCSIAMASGSEAAKHTANLVLLDSNFASMPHIVNEGRRVINNITCAASMFLIKTIFSVLLAFMTIFFGQAYPFEPVQLSIISGCAVGIPGFLLQLESNFKPVDRHFFRKVIYNAAPTAITISVTVFCITNIGMLLGCSKEMLTTVCVLTTGWSYMLTLQKVYSPMTKYRKFIIYSMQVIYLLCMIIGQKILELVALDFNAVILLLAVTTFSPMMIEGISHLYLFCVGKWEKRKKKRKLQTSVSAV